MNKLITDPVDFLNHTKNKVIDWNGSLLLVDDVTPSDGVISGFCLVAEHLDVEFVKRNWGIASGLHIGENLTPHQMYTLYNGQVWQYASLDKEKLFYSKFLDTLNNNNKIIVEKLKSGLFKFDKFGMLHLNGE